MAIKRKPVSAFPLLRKFRLFCAAMIVLCGFMYIPIYYYAYYDTPEGFVSGWPIETNRDTKIYVQPNNVTAIHEPYYVCRSPKNPKVLLLIIVCSATENYERRKAIRETWGDYRNYLKCLKTFVAVKEKYKNYNYRNDLYFKVLNLLKQSEDYEIDIDDEMDDASREFQFVFLLGQPAKENKSVQKEIEEEISVHGDIIQEGFIDSYNNLTLKSIMMLKWVTHKCHDSVRYILKTDDDTYINVPNLLLNLHNRSETWDEKWKGKQEYLLIGELFLGKTPVQDLQDKWFSPRYMYAGSKYPPYLSGMGYVMSMPTADALYEAALKTQFFHLEDIYITGMCVLFARPRIHPRGDPSFSHKHVHASVCRTYAQATAHQATPDDMHSLVQSLQNDSEVDRCEQIRLTQERRELLRGGGYTILFWWGPF